MKATDIVNVFSLLRNIYNFSIQIDQLFLIILVDDFFILIFFSLNVCCIKLMVLYIVFHHHRCIIYSCVLIFTLAVTRNNFICPVLVSEDFIDLSHVRVVDSRTYRNFFVRYYIIIIKHANDFLSLHICNSVIILFLGATLPSHRFLLVVVHLQSANFLRIFFIYVSIE